jgi:hypothetical protein
LLIPRSGFLICSHQPSHFWCFSEHAPEVIIARVGQTESRWGGKGTRGLARVAQAGENERILRGRGERGAPQATARIGEQPLAA